MLTESIKQKLECIRERLSELTALLASPKVLDDKDKFKNFSIEFKELEPIVLAYNTYVQLLDNLSALKGIDSLQDPDMKALIKLEFESLDIELHSKKQELQTLLLPKDKHDTRNIYLEVRAGTGGAEAALFSQDLFRMYSRYAESKGWQTEIVNESLSEKGGFKEVILRIIGQNVYSFLKFESGAHRVQRVPSTESQGRVHTSACTVAVLPEAEALDDIDLDPSLLRIDTFRASGAGGQHVNRTDSAIRITHLPSGLVVECQDERSQHKNKAKALAVLGSRLLAAQEEKQRSERAMARKSLVGTGDRSERIRTYNYSQGRLSDHRINLTLYKLSEILEGDLDLIILPLIQAHQAALLAETNNL